MNKKPLFTITEVLMLVLIGVGCFVLGFQYKQHVQTDPQDLPMQIAKRFADVHNYSDEYDCKNYSIDLNTVYDLLGYESYVIKNYEEAHAYVLVPLEPQRGELFNIKWE